MSPAAGTYNSQPVPPQAMSSEIQPRNDQRPPPMSQTVIPSDEDEEDEELVLYMTYNILKPVSDVSAVKEKIIEGIKRITHIDKSDIMIGNPDGTDPGFRKSFCTIAFEATITKPDDSKESFKVIRENISDAIKDGSFQDILNETDGILSLRDIYFKGIGRIFDDNYKMRYKRGVAEIKLQYPRGGHAEKMKFSKQVKRVLYDAINSLFDEFNLSVKRVQLELISAVDNEDEVILVQFMIMDSYSKLESSYSIASTINENLTRLVGGKIQEINMIERCYIFDIDAICNASNEKIDDTVKHVGAQKDNIVVVNSNCQDVVGNLSNNYVANAYLSENCNDVIDKELGITGR